MRQIINSTINKIILEGNKEIHLQEAIGLKDMDFVNTPVALIINCYYNDGSFERSAPISFYELIEENITMIINPKKLDFRGKEFRIKNKCLKTEFVFQIAENCEFELIYDIRHYS